MNDPIAMIPYTNMAPYRAAGVPDGCMFIPLVPSASVAAIFRRRVWAAALPVGALPSMGHLVRPVGAYGIGAAAVSMSVLFFSRRPFSKMTPVDPIRVTSESTSSVRLLRLLLGAAGQQTAVSSVKPGPNDPADGELIIGDRALQAHAAWSRPAPADDPVRRLRAYPYVTDLASVWFEGTGLPFVFARWVVRKDAPADLVARLSDWLAAFQRNEAVWTAKAVHGAAAELGLGESIVEKYFKVIRRCFTETDLAGEKRFLAALATGDAAPTAAAGGAERKTA